MGRPFPVDDVLLPKPVRRAEELACENIRLDFLAFTRRIAFNPACTAIDWFTAQSVRPYRHLIVGIVVKVKVPDLMRNHHKFINWVLADGDVHEPRRTVERPERAWVKRQAADFEVVLLKRGDDDGGGAAVALSILECLGMTLAGLSPDFNPRVHYSSSPSQ
jgi:hypothetical protein